MNPYFKARRSLTLLFSETSRHSRSHRTSLSPTATPPTSMKSRTRFTLAISSAPAEPEWNSANWWRHAAVQFKQTGVHSFRVLHLAARRPQADLHGDKSRVSLQFFAHVAPIRAAVELRLRTDNYAAPKPGPGPVPTPLLLCRVRSTQREHRLLRDEQPLRLWTDENSHYQANSRAPYKTERDTINEDHLYSPAF